MSILFKREPVLVINLVITVIEAGLALGIALGLGLSPEQAGAFVVFVVAIGNLVGTLMMRSQVTPVSHPRNNDGNPLVPVLSTERMETLGGVSGIAIQR